MREHFTVVEGEFQFAQSMDGNTIDEIQEALEESIRGGFGLSSGFVNLLDLDCIELCPLRL